MSNSATYTQDELDIAILKNTNKEFHRSFIRIEKHLSKIESEMKWLLRLMGTGFFVLLGLMAHGFKWY